MLNIERSSGLLLHITSLPGPFGTGTLGPEARRFCDLLTLGGQRCWQILPCGPVTPYMGYSPYASPSTFAGNDLLISLELLAEEPWCGRLALDTLPRSDADFADFDAACRMVRPLLEQAEAAFFAAASGSERRAHERFCRKQAGWLEDYALFTALSEFFKTSDWLSWPQQIAQRSGQAISQWRQRLAPRIRYHRFVQHVFFTQWQALKRYCNARGVLLIGDIPIYVTFESADAWANPRIFERDPQSGAPARVAGVPPDYFSATGQRWGNPLYSWHASDGRLQPDTLAWWVARIRHHSAMVDMLRIDHFRGFDSYWAIPAAAQTAVDGTWEKGPGPAFFEHLESALGTLNLIAEDLGVITPAVEELRARAGLPGMKVLQFAFDGDSRNSFLPHTYTDQDCVVYTGTHDNNTTNGWFYGPETDEATRAYVMDYAGTAGVSDFHWRMIRLAMQSTARLAIIPVQDVLGYGGELRMNRPGTLDARNWSWKLRGSALTQDHMQRLRRLCSLYGRIPENPPA